MFCIEITQLRQKHSRMYWGAACVKYTFPTMEESFSVTINYFSQNEVGAMSNNPTSIDELKTKIEMLGNQYGCRVHVANLFGSSDCETKYSCGQIRSVLEQNNPQLKKDKILALMRPAVKHHAL